MTEEKKTTVEINEVESVEATGSLAANIISCVGTWAAVGLLWAAACC